MFRSTIHALILAIIFCPAAFAEPAFRRGDADLDGNITLNDAIHILKYSFLGTAKIVCGDAADADDDGLISLNDPIDVLKYLFLDTVKIPAPGTDCGIDPTRDELSCASYPLCREIDPPSDRATVELRSRTAGAWSVFVESERRLSHRE